MSDKLAASDREALLELIARLKHDLGKYIAFQIRWVEDSDPFAERRRALEADLLETRRGPSGTVDAFEVWQEFRPFLFGQVPVPGRSIATDLSQEAEIMTISNAMRVISDVIDVLRDGTVSERDVRRGSAAALEVSEACRTLLRRMRTEL